MYIPNRIKIKAEIFCIIGLEGMGEEVWGDHP